MGEDLSRGGQGQAGVVPAVAVQPDGVASLGVGEVDGEFVHVADNAFGRFILFTQMSESVARPGRKTPEETGRHGLYAAIQTAYATAVINYELDIIVSYWAREGA